MIVDHIEITDDGILINGESYPLSDYVLCANGVEIPPNCVIGWFTSAVSRSKVVLDTPVLHNATVSLVQI